MIEVFSMVAGPTGQSKLVQIKAIDNNFPFYGDIIIKNPNKPPEPGKSSHLNEKDIAWLYPELLIQLNVKVNQQITIGQKKFQVKAIVENDNAEGISTSMAPRLYIGLSFMKGTELIQFGSVAWYTKLFKTPNNKIEELNSIKGSLDESLNVTDIKSYTHESVSEQSGSILKYLNDFLGLVSIAALFLAAIGGAFLFRSYLAKQLHIFGIYLSLGMTLKQIIFSQMFQLFILGLVGSGLALLFGFLLTPFLDFFIEGLLPLTLQKNLEFSTIILILTLGCFGSLLIGLPLVFQLINIKPKILFSSKTNQVLQRNIYYWIALIPGFLFLWLLAIWQSHSFKIGTLFTLLFLGSGLVISGIAYLTINIFKNIKIKKYLSLSWALRDIGRFPISSISIFLSIGLGTLLLNLIPQIKASINYELTMPKDSKLPSFFIFDIQSEQLQDLKVIAKKFSVNLQQTSPLVRARLLKVNNEDFSNRQIKGEVTTREQEQEKRSRNRGYNLSYRDGLGTGETIYKGVPFSGRYNEEGNSLPEISIEKRFAERMDLKIKDILLFDIQGVQIKGQIINVRKVRWTTFQPNFFIQFQPGVLNEAPKTYVSSVPKITADIKQEFQDKVVEKLPNVSIINVSRLVERLKKIIDQMSWALQFMTFICLLAGFLVLFSISNYQARQRSSDIALLKSLGANFNLVKSYFLWQFGILSVLAGFFGVSLCFIMSYFMSKFLFDSTWILDWKMPLITLSSLVIISLIITNFATSQFLKVKPAKLLGEL